MVKGTKVNIAKKYRDEHGLEMPTKKLARIMYSENNILFKDEENARDVLRYIEGKHGAKEKEKVMGSKYVISEARLYNPYNLPTSDETEYNPFNIAGHKRIVIFSDIHVPYHSMSAITAALDYCKKENPDALLINGDMLDCFQLSRFIKDPRKRHFAEELRIFKELIDIFKKVLNCKIYFKYGNHEERYEHFLFTKAKELVGIDEFELENIIKARANGIEIINEFSTGFFSPVNVARGLFLRGKTSAIQGHSHQTSEHTESNMNGKITTTWSVGCMSELHPAYAPINKWNHGFAIVDLDGEKFNVRNKRIYKGEVL
jgi:predicted phosphodiesterase